MPILNYTTEVSPLKSAQQIQQSLIAHGAKSIRLDYEDGRMVGLAFIIDTPFGPQGFKLPSNTERVYKVLLNQVSSWKNAEQYNWTDRTKTRIKKNHEQAERVAWRILKDWVEAQMAIFEAGMVQMEEIFLPYLITQGGKTLYNRMLNSQFQLTEGGS